ncbi:MAG: LysR substrate-binding domain-containing protein [Corynebacterium sp.]|nr:LysR substrate-binding domain-containing protein [Corynebacterium sp.]
MSNTVAELYYPGWAAEFHRQHPAVKLSMVQANSREVRQLVADSAVDFGLVEGEAGRHDLEEQIIGTDELVLAVPTGHPWTDRPARAESRQYRRWNRGCAWRQRTARRSSVRKPAEP